MERESSSLRKIYDWVVQHWFFNWIFCSLSGISVFIFSDFSDNFALREDGILRPIYLKIAIGCLIISLTYTFLKSLGDNYNEKSKIRAQIILGNIISRTDALKDFKRRRFEKYIVNSDKIIDPFEHITQPLTQIELLLDNLRSIISDIFKIDNNLVGISVLLKIKNTEWKFLPTINIREHYTAEELMNNRQSTAYHVGVKNKQRLIFIDKRKGIKKGEYLPDSMDAAYNNIGSIICDHISVCDGKVKAILSISTYGATLCNSSDQETISKITDVILPSFEKRIQVELVLQYIKSFREG